MAQKLLIDADPGIGDALAILIALADPQLDLVGLTAVRGTVSAVQAGRNLQSLLEAVDPPKWPRIGVPDQPESQPGVACESPPWELINGPSGLGALPVGQADLHHPREAAKLICELSREYPHELVVLTLGPLTNIAIAVERDPELLSRLKGLYCLGGTWDGPGNVTPAAEYNIYCNPTAARQILRSPATKTLIPWDLARRVLLTFDLFQRLPLSESQPGGRALQGLLGYALRSYHQHLGIEGMWLSEVVAVAAIARPELFQRSTVAMDIETEGRLTRGATIFDRRSPPQWRSNIDVLRHVDERGVLDYFMAMTRKMSQQAD